jgi:hypothetical protein
MLSEQKTYNNTTYRIASEVLSNTTFRKVIKESNYSYFTDKINQYSGMLPIFEGKNNGHVIEEIYKLLSNNYRNEYVYKNTILNSLIIQHKKLKKNTSIVLNEFKVGKSIADMVFINGENRVFEIKTELDSPERLKTQILDYQKVFSEIYIVTHWTLKDKYLTILQENYPNVGLYELKENLQIGLVKNSNICNDFLNIDTLFKLLRKEEYCNLLKEKFGYLPDVPNTLFFKECINLANSIDVEEFQKLVFKELKKRHLKELERFIDIKSFMEIKHICLCLDFSISEYNTLQNFLKMSFPLQND